MTVGPGEAASRMQHAKIAPKKIAMHRTRPYDRSRTVMRWTSDESIELSSIARASFVKDGWFS
jgi:hypothetical protein